MPKDQPKRKYTFSNYKTCFVFFIFLYFDPSYFKPRNCIFGYTFCNIHWYHNCFVHKFQICHLSNLQIWSFQFMYKLFKIKLDYFDFKKYYNAHLNTLKRGCCLFYLIIFLLKACPVGPKFHFLFGTLYPFDCCPQSLTIMDQTLKTQHECPSNNFFFTSWVAHL